jgi:hypothetical protein
MKKSILMCSLVAVLGPAGTLLATSGTALAQTAPLSRTVAPVIDGINVEQVARLEQGAELHFSLYGTQGANVTVNIDGATRGVQMQEVEPGQYSGTYTIGNRDRLRPDSRVSAEMRLGSQVATGALSGGLVRGDVAQAPMHSGQPTTSDPRIASSAAGASPPPPPRRTERPRVARYCTSCAIVEKVEVIQDPVSNPRPLASEVQARQRYRVTVRLNTTDATQAIEYDNNPGYRKGDRVRVNNGVLSLDKE